MPGIILITGATSGIGRACAHKFAKEGNRIIITGRRAERLESIASDLRKLYNTAVLTLAFDVRNRSQVNEAFKDLPENFRKIDILINNAGLALGLKPIQDGDPDQWETMIDTNVKGVLYVTHAVVPLMMQQGHGRIINIGSIAGKEAYLNGNVYCATKAAIDSLSKSMRIDLLTKNIKVTQVAPGAVETEFSLIRFSGDIAAANKVYQGFEPLRPDDVANVVHYCTTLPAHVNINDILLMPAAQASASIFNKN